MLQSLLRETKTVFTCCTW